MKQNNFIIKIIRILLALACAGALGCGIYMGIVQGIFETDYFITAFTALVSFAITYIPDFIRHIKLIAIPAMAQTVFTFLAMFFGEILDSTNCSVGGIPCCISFPASSLVWWDICCSSR